MLHQQFPLWNYVVTVKGLIFVIFPLRGCGGPERTQFNIFQTEEGVVVFQRLILSVFTLRGCGSLERNDFQQFTVGGCGEHERTSFQ